MICVEETGWGGWSGGCSEYSNVGGVSKKSLFGNGFYYIFYFYPISLHLYQDKNKLEINLFSQSGVK